MPLGNFSGSFVRLPDSSRDAAAQQSSRVKVSYPAARRPLSTIASAVSRTSVSSRPSHAKRFQLFQPIVGFVPVESAVGEGLTPEASSPWIRGRATGEISGNAGGTVDGSEAETASESAAATSIRLASPHARGVCDGIAPGPITFPAGNKLIAYQASDSKIISPLREGLFGPPNARGMFSRDQTGRLGRCFVEIDL